MPWKAIGRGNKPKLKERILLGIRCNLRLVHRFYEVALCWVPEVKDNRVRGAHVPTYSRNTYDFLLSLFYRRARILFYDFETDGLDIFYRDFSDKRER